MCESKIKQSERELSLYPQKYLRTEIEATHTALNLSLTTKDEKTLRLARHKLYTLGG